MEELREKLSGLLIARGRRRWRTRFMRTVAILVVFVTAYTMVMPALTLDENTVETAAGISLDEGKSEKKAETKKSKKKSKKKSSKKKSEKKEETEDDSAIKPAADKVKAKIGGAELTISYSKKAGLPEDVSVVVTEYSPNSDDKDNRAAYDAYFAMAQKKALDKGADEVTFARFFALQFFAGDQELVPEEGVKISVKYDKSLKLADDETYKAVQFGKDSAKLLKTTTKGGRKVSKASFTLKKFPGLGLIVTRKEAETKAAETEAAKVNEEAKEAAADVQEAEVVTEAPEKAEPEVITEAPQEEAADQAEPEKKEIVTQEAEEAEKADEADQADAEPAKEATVETADITEAAIAMAGIAADVTAAEEAQPEVAAEKAEEDAEPAAAEEADKKDSEDEQAAEAAAEEADEEEPEDGLTSEVISEDEAADVDNTTEEADGSEAAAAEDATDESATEEAASDEDAATDESALEETTAGEASDESAIAETTATETTAVETTAEETTFEETTVEETTEEAAEEEVYEAGELTYDGDGYKVVLNYSAEAKIPADATLSVRELQEGSAEYEAYRAQAEAAVAADPDRQLTFARAFDIKIQAPVEVEVEAAADAEAGEAQAMMTETVIREIQPAVPVSVQILLDEAVEVAPADEVKALHVEANDGTAGISAADPEVTAVKDVDYDAAAEGEEPAEVKEVEFKADGFSVWMIVGTELVTEVTLPGSDDTYEVSVTYGPEAKIPENVHLEVTALTADSSEYAAAKEAVMAVKSAEDEGFDENSLGFAALDISIVDDETGEKIEPADGAEVKVSFKMKSLPENINEDDLAETLEIQHLNESTGIAVVETVANADEVSVSEGNAEAEFTVESFSTFTITWSNVTNSTTNIRLRYGNNTRGQVTFNYVNGNGYSITRPTGVGGNVDINNAPNWPDDYEVIISSDNVARAITGRTYEKAYIVVNGSQQEVTRMLLSRTGNNAFSIAYYNGNTLVTTASGNNVTGDWRIPVYLQYTGDADVNEVTLHLVDANGNPLSGFTYNGETLGDESTFPLADVLPANGNTLDLTTAFTKEGYTFDNSFVNYRNGDLTGDVIGNELRRNNNVPQYRTYFGNNYTDITDGTDIYLVYSPVPSGSGGGGGGGDDGETPDLGEIGNSKSVNPNGDGTYKVALSISGTAQHKTEDTDINVVFVIDCSNSMTMWGRTRLAETKTAVKNMADSLLDNNTTSNPDAIELSLIAFNATAWPVSLGSGYWTTDYDTFATAVGTGNTSGITSSSGTNWEEALQQAISVDKGDGDATYVIFFTDGDPTEYAGHNDAANNRYEDNYWPARDEARAIVNSGKVLYGIYAYGETTGTHYLEPLVSYAYNGSSTGHYYNASNTSAVEQALADILDTINMNFAYANVEIGDGITGLSTVTFESVDPESFNYTITYKDYTTYTEYTTKTANITVDKAANTITIPEGITYKVPDPDDPTKTNLLTKTTVATTLKGATYSDKQVTWDLEKSDGSIYMLLGDWTYAVDFKVWPSQRSYDLIAALNNRVIDWGEDFTYTDGDGVTQTVTFAEYESQINQGTPYSLKTNTSASVKYQQVTETIDDQGHSSYSYGDEKTVPITTSYNMKLDSTDMPVIKKFDDDINTHNPYTQVRFYLTVDGKYYQTDGTISDTLVTPESVAADGVHTWCMDLNSSNNWSKDVFISPGVITDHTEEGTRVVKVLETGHEYSLVEKNITGDEYEYEFTPQTLRPMVVNGTLKYLVKADEYNPVPSSGTTYTIDGDVYFEAPAKAQALIGTNRKTGEIDITKVINDPNNLIPDGEEGSETFTYAVTLNIPAGKDASGIMGYEFVARPNDAYNGSNRIYIYGYQGEVDDEGNLISTPFTPDSTRFVDLVYGRYNSQVYRAFEGLDPNTARTVTVYLTLKQNEVIRFTNLPTGTTYSITEVAANVGKADDGNNYPAPITSFTVPAGGTPAEQGYTVSSKSSAGGTGGDTISGEITTLDTRYYHQFTNTVTSYENRVYAELKVKKVVEDYDWLSEYYRFTLAAGEAAYSDGTTGTSPMPSANSTGTYQVSIYNNTPDHTLSFGSIRYTKAGTYQYTLTEGTYFNYVDYADPVTITVTVEEQNGELVVTNIEDDAGTTVFTAATSTAQANGLTTQTNKLKTIDVSATKEWLKADGTTVLTDLPEGTTVTFTLCQGENHERTDQTIELNGEVDTNGESAAWVATWTGLPQYAVTTVTGDDGTQTRVATEIVYTIAEDIAPAGFEKITVDPVANGGTIQNKQLARDVNIQKRRQDGSTPLNGAIFDLYTKDGYESVPKAAPIKTNLTSEKVGDVDGVIRLGELTYGEYYLVETTAPAGYNKLTEAVKLTVNASGISILQSGTLRTDDDPEDTDYKAFITNDEGVELPHTGGSGTLPYTLSGIALMLGAALMYGFRMRRRERRYE